MSTTAAVLLVGFRTEQLKSLVEKHSRGSEVDDPMLAFMGGFDDPAVVLDRSKPTEFLVLMYPAVDYEDLRVKLGSVDFEPTLSEGPSEA